MNFFKEITGDIKTSIKEGRRFEISLIILFVLQFAGCCYLNFAHIKDHVGFDSSWSILRTILMWNEKSIVSSFWSEQNNLFLDSSTLFAVPIYALTKNVFLSFAIVNTIVLLLIVGYAYKILRNAGAKFLGTLFTLNLIICPFLTNGFIKGNDIGYFSNIVIGATHSSVRTLIALMIIYEFVNIRKNNKFSISTFITFLFCILSGAGIGVFLIIVMILPYLAYEFELVLIKNDWNVLKKTEAIFSYICAVAIVLGKVLITVIFKASINDASRTWTSIANIWKNIGLVIQGFMSLLNVLPLESDNNVEILSSIGITSLFPITIFVIIIISLVFLTKKAIKNYDSNNGLILFLLNVVVINFVIFSLFNVTYGAVLFEDRYLITMFFATILLLAFFIDSLDTKKIYTSVICVALIVSLYGNDFCSDVNYVVAEMDYVSTSENITDYFSENTSAKVIYVLGDFDNPFLQTTLRLYDQNHYYKLISPEKLILHFGDYTYLDNNEEYKGPTYLIVSDEFLSEAPEDLLEMFSYVDKIENCSIYYAESNPIDYPSYVHTFS